MSSPLDGWAILAGAGVRGRSVASVCAILAFMDDAGEPTVGTPTVDRYGSGTIKSEGFLLDVVMHGEWAFYRLDGSLMRSGRLDRGRQVGRWRTFDRAG